VRSLAFAMLNHRGDPNPAESDLYADRPWRHNVELAKTLNRKWRDGTLSDEATTQMLAAFRTSSPEEASEAAVDVLNKGVAPQSVWDAILVGSTELLMRKPGIVALHAVTTSNAMRHAFEFAADDVNRRLVLLQNCAFLPMFRDYAVKRGGDLRSITVDELEPVALSGGKREEAIEEIFSDVSGEPLQAAAKVRAFLDEHDAAGELIDAARRLIFVKGTGAHDYKFSSAVLEDYRQVSPAWRNRFLAMSVFNLRGSGDRDNRLIERARAALS